jgi:hypothetical protein
MGFLNGKSQENSGGNVNKVHLQYFGYKGKTAGSTEVAFNNLDVVILSQKLDIEGAGDIKGFGNFACNAFDPAHGFKINLLCRKNHGSIS